MDDIEIRRRLADLGAERQALDAREAELAAERRSLNRKVAKLSPKALSAGISKTEIAERTKVSRKTLYSILGK